MRAYHKGVCEMSKKSKFNWYRPQTLHQLGHDPDKPDKMAVAYARWLAKRDGVDIPKYDETRIQFTWNGLNGKGAGWARAVEFVKRCEGYQERTTYRTMGGGGKLRDLKKPKMEWTRWTEVVLEIEIPHSDFDPRATDESEVATSASCQQAECFI